MTRSLGKSKPHEVFYLWCHVADPGTGPVVGGLPASVSHHRAGVSSVMAHSGRIRSNRSRSSNVRMWQHGKTPALDNSVVYILLTFLREDRCGKHACDELRRLTTGETESLASSGLALN